MTLPATIPDILQRAAAHVPDQPWLHFGDTTFSFADAARRVNAASNNLVALGVQPGQLVSSVLPNSPEAVFSWLATMQLGAMYLPLNPRATATELSTTLNFAAPVLLLTDATTPPPELATTRTLPTITAAEAVEGNGATGIHSNPKPSDPAVLIQTSGTTGAPKLVVQSHRAYAMTAQGFPSWLGLTSSDHLLTCLPLFHLNAQAYSTLGSLWLGAPLTLLDRFSRSAFWRQLTESGATQFNFIGAMIEMFMRSPESAEETQHSARICFGGPTPEKERHLEFERRFQVRLTSGYGLSECPYGMIWPLEEPTPFGAIGRLRQLPDVPPVNEAKVVDDQGQPVKTGETGELLLRNPAVFLEYYKAPDATANAIREGWLWTGDLVRQDERGIYTFVGRKKDVIRRRGENLSPVEVEAVLMSHDDVAECAVVGVPDPLSEEEVKAFVVCAPGAAADPAGLQAWCHERLSAFKVPRYYEIVPELPKTPTDRIAKHKLSRDRTPAEVDLGL